MGFLTRKMTHRMTSSTKPVLQRPREKPREDAKGQSRDNSSRIPGCSSRLHKEAFRSITRQASQRKARLFDEAPHKSRCVGPSQHVQTCSTSLLMREVQVKIQTEPRSSTCSKVSKRENSLSTDRVEEQLETSHAVSGSETVGFTVSLDG